MRSRYYERRPDESTFEACQEALHSALSTAQQWSRSEAVDPQLKAKLALLIIRHVAKGETDPMMLRKQALTTYFLESAGEESAR
jgi:hypothetical protein